MERKLVQSLKIVSRYQKKSIPFQTRKLEEIVPAPVALEKSLSTVAVQFSSLRKVCVVEGIS